ncbi:MAG: hypothetical protein RDU25_05015 [Patescibacteria group bacterium]|nr:hypothetical protein [Patescibacteria group bacterium]
MDKKTLIFYVAIVVIGLGTMVGLVLFLRSRNAPVESTVLLENRTAPAPQTQNLPGQRTTGKVRYATPLDKTPKAEPYKQGEPVTAQQPTIIISDDGLLSE